MTERLKRCIDGGGVVDLFPLLRDWPEAELRELLNDAEAEWKQSNDHIKAAWKSEAFKAENFLSSTRSAAIDDARDRAAMDVLAMLSEICSVAEYYLADREPERVI